jgi:hypothetical protein
MGDLVVADFCRTGRRRGPRQSASVHPFPLHHRRIVQSVAQWMAARPSMDEVEHELATHLGIHWDFLEAAGVGCDEIEVDCHRFAKAAWLAWQDLQAEEASVA